LVSRCTVVARIALDSLLPYWSLLASRSLRTGLASSHKQVPVLLIWWSVRVVCNVCLITEIGVPKCLNSVVNEVGFPINPGSTPIYLRDENQTVYSLDSIIFYIPKRTVSG
jgi:hypothetical protein